MSKHILLADDDKLLIQAMALALESEGYTVSTAGTAREVVELLDADSALDLVVMDIMQPTGGIFGDGTLPVDAGLQLLKMLRGEAWPRYAQLPVICYTVRAIEPDVDEQLRLLDVVIVPKGGSPTEVLNAIKAVFGSLT